MRKIFWVVKTWDGEKRASMSAKAHACLLYMQQIPSTEVPGHPRSWASENPSFFKNGTKAVYVAVLHARLRRPSSATKNNKQKPISRRYSIGVTRSFISASSFPFYLASVSSRDEKVLLLSRNIEKQSIKSSFQ